MLRSALSKLRNVFAAVDDGGGAAVGRSAVPGFSLLHLSDDELEVIGHALADPLEPHAVIALASTCRGLRTPTKAALAELRRRHEAVKALCEKEVNGTHWTVVRDAEVLSWCDTGLTDADMTAVSDIVKGGLPRLEKLCLSDNCVGALPKGILGDEGMQALASGLGRGALPSLTWLDLSCNKFGDAGASALGPALDRGALPRLQELELYGNDLGSAGLIALAPGLRARPHLKKLWLSDNNIDGEGLAALVAPGEGVLPSLEELYLDGSRMHIGDTGCASLVAALDSGMMPALKWLVWDHYWDAETATWSDDTDAALEQACERRDVSTWDAALEQSLQSILA